jgi:predicted transcriptional regulator
MKKEEARRLRQSGMSLFAIAEKLGVAKSSVSVWVRDIVLTSAQRQSLKQGPKVVSSAVREWNEKQKSQSAERVIKYRQEGFNTAAQDHQFRVICALYWGEGHKANPYFKISNCDWKLMRVVYNWLVSQGFGDIIRFHVVYHEGGLTAEEIGKWWMEKLPGLKTSQFQKFTTKRAGANKKWPYGVANLIVHRRQLYEKLMGGIDYLTTFNEVFCVKSTRPS